MNILFISLMDIRSVDDRNIYTDLMREFLKHQHNVYIVSPSERRCGMSTQIIEDDGDQLHKQVHILKIKTGNIQKTNVIEKGISTLLLEYQLKHGIKKYFKKIHFDLILYSTPPITLIKPIKYVKHRDNAKSYLMLKDIFPQNAVDLGMLKKTGVKGVLYKYFRSKERKLYAVSDNIGCMSPANKSYLIKHNPHVDRDKVDICPNSIEVIDTSVDEQERFNMRKKYGIPQDKIVFVYGGNLGKPQGIEFLIKCLKSQKNNDKVYFLIAGSGTEYHKLRKFVIDEKQENVKIMSQLPKNDYDKMVGSCDVGMIFLDHRFTIPNFPSRLLAYMQAGLPVLACTDCNTDIGKFIVDSNIGLWCESNNTSSFTDVVNKFLISKKENFLMGINSFNQLKAHFSVEYSYQTIVEGMMEVQDADMISKQRLLIISNNVLSNNRNNGKTIYSYIDSVPAKNVAQLYFSSEKPSIKGYKYFQISDYDVLRGMVLPEKRGRMTECSDDSDNSSGADISKDVVTVKNNFTRIIREIVWYRKWKSDQLSEWLDEFNPTSVFFVGGDSMFAYKICEYITHRFSVKLTTYITDDYIMPRETETILGKIRRILIRKNMRNILSLSNNFYTVSPQMQKAYSQIFKKDSKVIFNLTESLKDESCTQDNSKITIMYAGSLYYGRDHVIELIASAVEKFNENSDRKAQIKVFTNTVPDEISMRKISKEGCSKYCGSLNRDELKKEMNQSDILLFVESFDKEQIEKTRFSLSTKVSEYLSVGKIILAVGPKGIGSIDYLSDAAFCINNYKNIIESTILLLNSLYDNEKYADLAYEKYIEKHDKEILQSNFLVDVL